MNAARRVVLNTTIHYIQLLINVALGLFTVKIILKDFCTLSVCKPWKERQFHNQGKFQGLFLDACYDGIIIGCCLRSGWSISF